jgi:hypothetical protein
MAIAFQRCFSVCLFISFWFVLMMLIYWAETYVLLKNTEAVVVASKGFD